MSSLPDITVAALDFDELCKWRDVIYRKIEILLAECTRNIKSQLDESDEEGADFKLTFPDA